MRMLQTNNAVNRKEFRRHQRIVKTVVDYAREEWICKTEDQPRMGIRDGAAF